MADKMRNKTDRIVPVEHLPRHIGIIMDGNGRWAKKRGLPRSMGHVQGAKIFKEISLYCADRGVQAITFYAFSTENWKRPVEEVNALMRILEDYLDDALTHYREKNIRAHILGDVTPLPEALKEKIAEVETSYTKNTGMILNIALNYGSRTEILRGVQNIAEEVRCGRIAPEDINEQLIDDSLYTGGQPPIDLIIRPSG